MGHLGRIKGEHKLVAIGVPGRPPPVLLCLVQRDAAGREVYYVLAERDGESPLKWRSLVKDSAVRRLKDEFIARIIEARSLDELDVETILFCAAEVSKA